VASSCDYSKDVVFEGSMAKHPPGRAVRSIYAHEDGEQLRPNQSAQKLPSSHSLRGNYQGTYEDYMRNQGGRQRTEEDRTGNAVDPTFSARFGTAEQHSQEHQEMVQVEQYRQAVMHS
jgi:hypothetical protein